MPIDVNLANWNKENENCAPLRTFPLRLHGVTSASAGALFTPKSRRVPLSRVPNYSALASCASVERFSSNVSLNGTARCHKFFKRADYVAEKLDQRWTKIRQAFLDDKFLRKDDDKSIISELLTLCSWWSENESLAKGFNSELSENDNGRKFEEEDKKLIFAEVTNYLRNSSALRLAAVNHTHFQHYKKETLKFFAEESVVAKKPFVYPSTMGLSQISVSEFDLNASF